MMTPRELAEWIAEEHVKVRAIADQLRTRVATIPVANRGKWIEELRRDFDRFRAHMIKHMALEEQDGYMMPVVECRPAMSREADRLAHEHNDLAKIMDEIHRQLAEARPECGLIILDACHRIRDLLGYVEHHEKEENLLVLSAFTSDIGTKD